MTYDDWNKVGNPWRVVEAASESEAACQSALARVIDTMLELKLDCRHKNPGFQPFSVTALAGEVPGGGGRSDQAMLAAQRYHPDSEWHRACAFMLDRLPRRQAAAMMLQAARIRPEKAGESEWKVTASQMVQRQALLLRSLGMAEGVRPYESVESLQKCARRARTTLRNWIAQQEVRLVA